MWSRESQIDYVRAMLQQSIDLKQQVMESQADIIVDMAAKMEQTLRHGGKVLFCGNGGSAADAQHLSAELLIRLRPHINRGGLAALSLATDSSSMTACGNDYTFDAYYERMVLTLGRPGDLLVGISTSGRSPNVVRALQAARTIEVGTLGLLGASGGPALATCDLALVVPSTTTGRIQEVHIAAGHAILELVEEMLLENRHSAQEEKTCRPEGTW